MLDVTDHFCADYGLQEDQTAFDKYFCGTTNGFFLEIGANGGLEHSNTYAFERALGWTGMLIDGDERLFLGPTGTKVNRTNTINLFAPICSQSQSVHYISNEAVGAVGGIVEFMTNDFKTQWYNTTDNQEIFARPDCTETPCFRLQTILDHFGVEHIHFFSLDTEGAELEVLRGLDFKRTEVDVFVIEMDGSDKEKEKEIHEYLIANRYRLDFKDRNEWWLREEANLTPCVETTEVKN